MITELFATPISRQIIKDKVFIETLESFILSSMNDANRINKPPQSAHNDLFESKFDFLKWDDPVTNHCKTLFLKVLLQFLEETTRLSLDELSKLKIYHESWFHVANRGGYFQAHTHPNASWSVVLCVNKGDDEVLDEHEAGCLVFVDPRVNASMHLDPANKDLKRTFSFNGYRFRPSSGEIFIFPSFLQHSVEPYYGENSRISVAANFWFGF